MTQETGPNQAGQIARKVREFLERRSSAFKEAAAKESDPLFTSGILDSMTFVQLVAFIEREFKIRLPRAYLLNFSQLDTLESVERVVLAQLEK